MSTTYVEIPFWKPDYAGGISGLLNDIPTYFEHVKKFVKDPRNDEFVKGFFTYHRLLYLTECNNGENTGTKTLESTETALSGNYCSRNNKKTQNLSNALNYLFGDSLLVESLNHEFNVELAKKLNKLIGDELFDNAGHYRKKYAKPAGCDFLYLDPHLIEEHMNKLFSEIKELEISAKNWYEVASSFLVKFLYIHPFTNGNGRTARLLISALLIKYSIIPISLFVSAFNPVHSNEIYLRCISEAQRHNNYLLLNSLMIESAHYTLHKFIQSLDIEE